jgi:L-aminopeptidase/D-esterase-like protein
MLPGNGVEPFRQTLQSAEPIMNRRIIPATKVLFVTVFCAALATPVPTVGQQRSPNRGITAVQGIRVGHHTLAERPTGCTVILADGQGAVGGVAQRGGAPGTAETDLLDPANLVEYVNAVALSGGSAFGLDVRTGVVKYLEERKVGYSVSNAGVVPIVPAAILFDLPFGGAPGIRPAADCGYKAAQAAVDGPVAEGNVGAGAGATVGKLGGRGRRPMKAGVGSAAIALENGLVVGAIVAVNAIGDVIDPLTGQVVAGVRGADGKLADARKVLRESAAPPATPGQNTTIAVVATNARLTKAQAQRMALMADDGLARAIYPAHSPFDGDTVFALATGRWDGTVNLQQVGALAAEALSEAIVRAATQATSSGGLPAARDLGTVPARFK